MYWIPTVIFLAHFAEEIPRFPQWATRHFGATSRAWYVYSHIVLAAITIAISAQAQAAAAGTAWPMLATSTQWVLATNALFHITTTFLFKEYSPGLVTATILFLPATAYVLHRTLGEDLLTPLQLACALALGTMVGVAFVASLWLRTDFDWRLRRGQSPVASRQPPEERGNTPTEPRA